MIQKLKFSDVIDDKTGGHKKIAQKEYLPSGNIPIIDQGSDFIGGYTNDNEALSKLKLPCIIFGDHTKAFKFVNQPFAIGADGVKVLKPKILAHEKYLYYYLSTIKLPEVGYSRHFKFLKEEKIPLPPLEEQKRIAQILDKADEVIKKRERTIKLLDEFLKSTFLDMFGDPITNPKGWEIKKLGDLGKVSTGNTPSRNNLEYYGDFIEWIKSDNLNTPYYFATKASEYLSKEGAKVGRIAPKNSILVTCIAGSKECIGNAAIIDRNVCFNQQINSITPEKDIIDLYFLYSIFLFGKKLVQNASTNSMKGMVNKTRFENIDIILPPKDLQHSYSDMFKKHMEILSKLHKDLEHSKTLFNSLTQKAFKGEL